MKEGVGVYLDIFLTALKFALIASLLLLIVGVSWYDVLVLNITGFTLLIIAIIVVEIVFYFKE